MEHPQVLPPLRRPAADRESGLCPASPLIWVTLWNISSCYSPSLALRVAPLSPLSSSQPLPRFPPQPAMSPDVLEHAHRGAPPTAAPGAEATLRLLLRVFCLLSAFLSSSHFSLCPPTSLPLCILLCGCWCSSFLPNPVQGDGLQLLGEPPPCFVGGPKVGSFFPPPLPTSSLCHAPSSPLTLESETSGGEERGP